MIVSLTVVLLVVASPLTNWASVDAVLEACASTVAIFWVITGYTYLQKCQENEVMDGQPIRKIMLQNTVLTLAGCIFLNVWMIKW